MKLFSARELAVLCLPFAAIVGVFFWASQHKGTPIPLPPEPPPKLRFSSRPPTTLEAFDGVKTVLVAEVGRDSRGSEYRWSETNQLFWLKTGDEKTSKLWRSDGSGSIGKEAFSPSIWGDASIDLPLKSIPTQSMIWGLDAKVISTDMYQPTRSFNIKGQRQIDKSQIEPFDFSLDKAPLTHLREMGISNRDEKSVTLEVEFTYDKAGENHNTPFEAQFQERHGRLGWSGVSSFVPLAPQNWKSVVFVIERSPSNDSPFEITGRVSANNRWPLAFKIGPFKFDDVKIGKPLPFKSWPAPLPPGAKN